VSPDAQLPVLSPVSDMPLFGAHPGRSVRFSLVGGEEERAALENRLKQWITVDFRQPDLFPLDRTGKRTKFTAYENAILAWLLIAMAYPLRLAMGERLTDLWKVATVLMGLPLTGSDPGKKVRNHVNEVLANGPKRPLSPVEEAALKALVDTERNADGEVAWARIERQMEQRFKRPFGAGRLKDDWHNFLSGGTRLKGQKRARNHEHGALSQPSESEAASLKVFIPHQLQNPQPSPPRSSSEMRARVRPDTPLEGGELDEFQSMEKRRRVEPALGGEPVDSLSQSR